MNGVIDLMNLEENKVTTNLLSYPMVLMSEHSGDGKTDSLNRILRALSNSESKNGKKPLFLMFEDRYQHIPNIMAMRIRNMADLQAVLGQLKIPAVKEKFSCVVFDTVDQMDAMIEKYIAVTKEVEITGDLQFGKGNKYIKNTLYFLNDLRADGWKCYFLCQSIKNENIITHKTTYEPKLNKETWAKISETAYLIGMLSKDGRSEERLITFEKTDKYPVLKDSIGMPRNVKVSEFKEVLDDAIKHIDGAEFTDEDTINGYNVVEVDFNKVIERGNILGGLLFKAGQKQADEALNILRTNIGVKDEKTKAPMMFSDLVESQCDLAQVIVMKLEDLCKKYGISVPNK